MRKFIKIALFTIILSVGLNSTAYCAILESQFVINKVKKDIIKQLEQDYDGKVNIEIKHFPYKTIDIPDGNVKMVSEIGNLSSKSIIKVSIYVNEMKVKTFGLRAEISIKDKVWVAKDWIRRGDTLKNLKMVKTDISSALDKLPGKNFNPSKYMARRNIRPGDIIERNDIETIPTIVRNSPVSVIFKTPTVSVTIPCIALTSGKTGDFIKVKSKAYKKNYVGKIIGKNLVLVNI